MSDRQDFNGDFMSKEVSREFNSILAEAMRTLPADARDGVAYTYNVKKGVWERNYLENNAIKESTNPHDH